MSKRQMNMALVRLGKAINRMGEVELTPEQNEIMTEISQRYWAVVNTFVGIEE